MRSRMRTRGGLQLSSLGRYEQTASAPAARGVYSRFEGCSRFDQVSGLVCSLGVAWGRARHVYKATALASGTPQPSAGYRRKVVFRTFYSGHASRCCCWCCWWSVLAALLLLRKIFPEQIVACQVTPDNISILNTARLHLLLCTRCGPSLSCMYLGVSSSHCLGTSSHHSSCVRAREPTTTARYLSLPVLGRD